MKTRYAKYYFSAIIIYTPRTLYIQLPPPIVLLLSEKHKKRKKKQNSIIV